MKIEKLLDVLHVGIDFDSNDRIGEAVKFIHTVQNLTSDQRDVIVASFENGPLYDGDVPSKTGRDQLIDIGFVSKVVVKGEEGYNACTYLGARAYRLIRTMQAKATQ